MTGITSLHSVVPAPAFVAVLDNIQHRYNPNWSCPLTPWENRVKVAIRAGEKDFPGAIHEYRVGCSWDRTIVPEDQ
jgi:hypothetical protein